MSADSHKIPRVNRLLTATLFSSWFFCTQPRTDWCVSWTLVGCGDKRHTHGFLDVCTMDGSETCLQYTLAGLVYLRASETGVRAPRGRNPAVVHRTTTRKSEFMHVHGGHGSEAYGQGVRIRFQAFAYQLVRWCFG